jgi:four helix bundle protein
VLGHFIACFGVFYSSLGKLQILFGDYFDLFTKQPRCFCHSNEHPLLYTPYPKKTLYPIPNTPKKPYTLYPIPPKKPLSLKETLMEKIESIKSFKELIVWQESVVLAEMIYSMTRSFPKEELFGLTSQMRRSAVSIASNIAEGYGRANRKEYLHFLSVSTGSLHELETQLIIANRVSIVQKEVFDEVFLKIQVVNKILFALRRSLR